MPDLSGGIEQPYGVEIHFSDGIFIKQMHIPKAGTIVPQHAHEYDHLSMLAAGAVRVWAGGLSEKEYVAPIGIPIAAGVKHRFLSLVDNTVIYCIHNISRTGEVDIAEEHQIPSYEALR